MGSRLAGIPSGRRTKWLVLIAWLVLLMAAGALGGKLQSVTKNNADAYLPGSAEATQVVKLQSTIRKDDSTLAIVSYERRSGITPADRTAAQQAAADLGKLPRDGQVVGPLVSRDGQAMQILVPVKGDRDVVVEAIDDIRTVVERAPPRPRRPRHRPGRRVVRPGQGVREHRRHAAAGHACRRDRDAAADVYRSPLLWFVPLFSAGSAYLLAQGAVYLHGARPGSRSTARAPASSPSWSSARAPTTRCWSSPATARNCTATRTSTRPWRWRSAAPAPRSWPAAPPSASACCACSSPSSTRPAAWSGRRRGHRLRAARHDDAAARAARHGAAASGVLAGRAALRPGTPPTRDASRRSTASGRGRGVVSARPRVVWVGTACCSARMASG